MTGDAVVARARGAVGVRFRLHGRDPATGLDCVGLVAHALGQGDVPSGYALRGGRADAVAALLDARLARGDGAAAGDVLVTAPGPGQLHLAIRTEGGFVHADAGLARVVERPGDPPWLLVGAWRLKGG